MVLPLVMAGLAVAGTVTSMYGQSKANKYNTAMENYRNGMKKLQSAKKQNSITVNEIYAISDTKRKNLANEIEFIGASSTLSVQSAVSGFSGRTANAITNAQYRAKALKTLTIEESYERSRRSSDMSRMNTAFGTTLSLEDGYVQPVNWLGGVTSGASSAIKSYYAGKDMEDK